MQVMDRTATHACKQWRKQLRAMQKCYADIDKEREGIT